MDEGIIKPSMRKGGGKFIQYPVYSEMASMQKNPIKKNAMSVTKPESGNNGAFKKIMSRGKKD